MAKKKVFVSFDYTKDKYYKFLLEAWDANKNMDFVFSDFSSQEIQSDNISVIKANLTKKIKQATYTLVIIGEDATKKHPNSKEIGYNNWQSFEVAKSIENGNKIVGVKISSGYTAPAEMLGIGTSWASSFAQDKIIEALDKA